MSTFWSRAQRVVRGVAIAGAAIGVGQVFLWDRSRRAKLAKAAAEPAVAVVRLSGIIAANMDGGLGRNLTINLQRCGPQLASVFEQKNVKTVLIQMNSPGGSPVQSSLLHKHIKQLRKKHPEKTCICFVEDVCASGGYFIASACDKIYCDESSILGSIGVIRADFKLKNFVQQFGIERRILTAGQCKSQLDPFVDEKPEDLVMVNGMMEKLHRQFIDVVKRGRGERLKEDVAAQMQKAALAPLNAPVKEYEGMGMFDGSVYTGVDAVEVGFADGIDTVEEYVARECSDMQVFVSKQPKTSLLELLAGLGQSASLKAEMFDKGALVRSAAEVVTEYEMWGQYGLLPPRS